MIHSSSTIIIQGEGKDKAALIGSDQPDYQTSHFPQYFPRSTLCVDCAISTLRVIWMRGFG
ncbi:MAG: hypothetical protein ACE5EY_08835 [Anaerolineae bacterium]